LKEEKLMKSFNRREILNCMIDSLERSKSKKDFVLIKTSIFKEYQNELNYRYILEFNELCSELESSGIIEVKYSKHNSSFISSIKLFFESASILYNELERESFEDKLVVLNKIINEYSRQKSQTLISFAKYLKGRIAQSKSIKKYCDIDNLTEFQKILTSISKLEELEKETLKRKFSARYLNDSKYFELIEGKVCRIIRDFDPEFEFMSNEEILDRFYLVKYPSQIILKGNCEIFFDEQKIAFTKLGVIHIEASLVELINKIECGRVITIENKATFYEYTPDDELVIYTGGFPNKLILNFINIIVNHNSDIRIKHFSDIDLGGFLILKYLRESVAVQVDSYNMNKDILNKYLKFCKTGLTQNSVIRLKELLKSEMFTSEEKTCMNYILEKELTLEQENILLSRK